MKRLREYKLVYYGGNKKKCCGYYKTAAMKGFGNSMLPILKSGSLLTYTTPPVYKTGDIASPYHGRGPDETNRHNCPPFTIARQSRCPAGGAGMNKMRKELYGHK
jgi:hypothetical protein